MPQAQHTIVQTNNHYAQDLIFTQRHEIFFLEQISKVYNNLKGPLMPRHEYFNEERLRSRWTPGENFFVHIVPDSTLVVNPDNQKLVVGRTNTGETEFSVRQA